MTTERIIDISIPVHPAMPIYPGDQTTEFDTFLKPSGSQLTKVTMGSHAGTHIDGPSHSIAGDKRGVDVYDLGAFYGLCRVIEIDGKEIDRDSLVDYNIQAGERILFKTANSRRGYEKFYNSWVGITSDAAEYLAGQHISLVGVDWFGIKQKGAVDNLAHTALLSKKIPILEGLDLAKVEPGEYTLAAFPIAYQQVDGAPARAVLIANQ